MTDNLRAYRPKVLESALRYVGTARDWYRYNSTHYNAGYRGAWDNEIQGVIYRLPARKGRCRYLIGYAASDDDHQVVDVGTLIEGAGRTELDREEALRDAAHQADSSAERAASRQHEILSMSDDELLAALED